MKKIYFAIPCYRGDWQIETVRSFMRSLPELMGSGHSYLVSDRVGSGLVHDVRNLLVAQFLASDCTDMVFIDDDVSWGNGDLVKLVSHPVDCVAGVYRHKTDKDETYPLSWLPREELWADPETGLLEVSAVPAGFLRLSRKCLEDMVSRYAHLEYRDSEAPDGKAWGLFYPEIVDRASYGEDINFCRRYRAIGGRVWIDPEMSMQHVGRKVYCGHVGNWLRGRK